MKTLDEILKNVADEATSRMNTPTSSSDNREWDHDDLVHNLDHGDTASGAAATPAASPAAKRAGEAAQRGGAPLLDTTCKLCGGAGFVLLDVPVGHPDFGKAVPCRCRAQERMAKRVKALQSKSSIAALSKLTFDTFISAPSHLGPAIAHNVHRAVETCLYYAREPEGWLVLTGAYGCGKTHLVAAIANARVEMGEPAIFMVVPDLLDHLRAAYSPTSDVSYDNLFEQLRDTPLLILDDFGAQSSTAWAQEKLFQLLNHRYIARLPTVITTNQNIDEMEPRLRSRLHDPNLVTVFAMLAPDFRTGKNTGQTSLSTLSLHREQTFAGFDRRRSELSPGERANLDEVLGICQAFAQEPQGWLVLAGTYGCGKTHLAAAIANTVALREDPSQVMFVVVPDLLDHLRAAFSPQSTMPYDRLFTAVKNAHLLILDDLGTESATPWAKEKLFQLLNYRYTAQLPTVITTSTEPKDIEPWLRTRMLDTARCQFCGLAVPAYRRAREGKPRKRNGFAE
jgi:DNA replication protein DnaC